MKTKRVTSLLIAVIMVYTLMWTLALPTQAATNGSCGENLSWTLDDNGTLTISGAGAMLDYKYDAPWSDFVEDIEIIIIGNDVTSIGAYAFADCYNTTAVTISQGVETIGEMAFGGCRSLKNFHIPKSVAEIGEAAFVECEKLQNISVDESNAAYLSINGNLYTKDKSILIQYALGKEDTFFAVPDGVESIGAWAFANSQNLSAITMSDSVTRIGKYAFAGCFFEAICLSNALTSIEEGAFDRCEFWYGVVAIPKSVKSIGKNAFRHCWNLSEIKIQGNEISIEDNAFEGTEDLETVFFGGTEEDWEKVQIGSGNESLTRADINHGYGDTVSGTCGEELTWSIDGNGLLTISGIGYMEFEGSEAPWYEIRDLIRAVSVSENVEYISYRAFENCYFIETVEILGSAVEIEECAFKNCVSLRSIHLPEELDCIEDSTFYGCKSLQNIEIPATVYRIDDNAFADCQSLISIEIPESVERINSRVFAGCNNLRSIDIPKNVEKIGGGAFANSGIESIVVSEDNPYYCALNGSLYTKDKTKILRYAEPKTETEFIVPSCVTEIGSGSFSGADHLTSIILPTKLEFIESDAFYNCKGLTSIVIPSGVIEIGRHAFGECINLKIIEIPLSLTHIGEDAFFWCRSLTDVVYEGSAELWADMQIADGNDALLDTNLRFQNWNIYIKYDIETDKIYVIGNSHIEIDEASLHIAAYKGNAVVSFETMVVPVLTGECIVLNPLQNIDDADRIRFMLWDGAGMVPVAKAIEQRL